MEKKINNNKILIITHISDIDGLGSAILGSMAFKNYDYALIEISEQPQMLELILETNYEEYYICDLGIEPNIADELASSNKNIFVFDHHKTHTYINKYPFAKVEEFCNGKKTCGTHLFYNYLISNNLIKKTDALDEFVELIRSYDTWDWTIENNIMANDLNSLFSVLGTTEFINTFSESLKDQEHFAFTKEQRLIIDLREKEIVKYVEACNNNFMIIEFDNLKAGVLFSGKFNSRVGSYLCSNNDIDFAMMIDMLENGVSLRSTKEIDVSVIAQKFGGGGHMHAAGFPLNEEKKILLLEKIIEYLSKKES